MCEACEVCGAVREESIELREGEQNLGWYENKEALYVAPVHVDLLSEEDVCLGWCVIGQDSGLIYEHSLASEERAFELAELLHTLGDLGTARWHARLDPGMAN